MINKKDAPEPRRREDDIWTYDEILISSTIVTVVIGVIFLILGGLRL